MSRDKVPQKYFLKLELKLIDITKRPNLKSNLWCVCKCQLDPVTIYIGSQAIAFTIMIDNLVFGLMAIYA